ncbi:MAG TPA: glycosyltransferase family 4 protein [Gemmatimonadaceae bacterium]|nr:glycosyltransferase family 4 protein [Gemmatimonadaceae bacterium]
MQRVAQGLHAALRRRPEVTLSSVVLRTSWSKTHLRVPVFMARLLWDIPRRVERAGIEVVLFSSLVTAAAAPFLKRRLSRHRVCLVAVVHGRDATLPVRPYQWVVPRVLGALDGVLAVSEATGRACMARGLHASKLHVVGNGVDPVASSSEDRATARAALLARLAASGCAVPGDGFLVFSAGRHVARKGFRWFASEVVPRLTPDVHYVLAGEGPETAAIRATITQAHLAGRVHLLGKVTDTDLARLYHGSDLFVMPNLAVPGDLEGFGLVVAEAALAGLPVVAAEVDGIAEVLRITEGGTLVPSADAHAFVAAIEGYREGAFRRKVGDRAAECARERLTWPHVVTRYLKAMEEIRDGRRVPAFAV